jgi:chemosensory pili system protein ChpB (putative protein-glutamate methylesterase)
MSIPEEKHNPLCVAIVAGTEHQRTCLRSILEENALQVTDDNVLQDNQLIAGIADVLLVNLDDKDDEDYELFIDQTAIPVLINDSASIRMDKTPCGRAWGRRLAEKLVELAANDEGMLTEQAIISEVNIIDEVEIIDKEIEELTDWEPVFKTADILQNIQGNQNELPESTSVQQENADEIWVLAASIGGPDAVKRFLTSLPPDSPAGFILAQHIGPGFAALLVEQMGKISSLEVLCAEEGYVIKRNQLIVAPAEKKFGFHDDRSIKFADVEEKSIYAPSIDNVMSQVAYQYGRSTRAILFSGMGNDGLKGAKEIVAKGGIIWAQEASSCVISSMADSVREAGLVSETETPERLAMKLVQFLSEEATL